MSSSRRAIDDLDSAQKFYQMALGLNNKNTEALLGSVYVDLLQENFQKAAEELFVIKQVTASLPPKAAFLNSVLARNISKPSELDHLEESLSDQVAAFDANVSR